MDSNNIMKLIIVTKRGKVNSIKMSTKKCLEFKKHACEIKYEYNTMNRLDLQLKLVGDDETTRDYEPCY